MWQPIRVTLVDNEGHTKYILTWVYLGAISYYNPVSLCIVISKIVGNTGTFEIGNMSYSHFHNLLSH